MDTLNLSDMINSPYCPMLVKQVSRDVFTDNETFRCGNK